MSPTEPLPMRARQLGNSDNRADYEAVFLRQVHRLLQIAYESLDHAQCVFAEEDDISGEICRHIEYLTEVSPSERWMRWYCVKDQSPRNDQVPEPNAKRRLGKRRPRIDLRIVGTRHLPNTSYCIEAKRLYRSDSDSRYVGHDGLEAFLRGDYASSDTHAGMMGYVQSDTVAHWGRKLEKKLAMHKSRLSMNDSGWSPVSFSKGPQNCFRTEHLRDSGHSITVHHVLFDFAKTNVSG